MKKNRIVLLAFMGLIIIPIGITVKLLVFKGNEKPKMVIVLQDLNNDYSKTVKAGIEKGLADLDIDGEIITYDLEYPVTTQVAMLKDGLQQNPDALIVNPTESSATIPVFKEYQGRNIPVVVLNQDIRWKDQTTFIGTNHLRFGEMAGEVLSSSLQPGDQVVLIADAPVNSIENDWIKAAKEAIENVGIETIIEQWDYDKSGSVQEMVSNLIRTHPDIGGILSTNDSVTLGAIKVIEKNNLKALVIGMDGGRGVLQAVEQGKLSVVLAQNPYDMGYLSVEHALKAIKGEHVEKRIDSGIDIITKDNAKSTIDFYTKEVFK